jgi:hypothetical protein
MWWVVFRGGVLFFRAVRVRVVVGGQFFPHGFLRRVFFTRVILARVFFVQQWGGWFLIVTIQLIHLQFRRRGHSHRAPAHLPDAGPQRGRGCCAHRG